MEKSGVEAAVFVQCLNSCPEEVAWVASLAKKHKFIKGIVAGLDLTQVVFVSIFIFLIIMLIITIINGRDRRWA